MIHPELKIQAMYELEGDYFATLMEGMFVALPNPTDVKLCLMTQGHLCMFDQALYPVDRLNWCVYAPFINDKYRIKNNCVLKATPRTTNLAHSLDGYLWAISSLATEKLQIRCMLKSHVITIKPPLQIIDVGNRCEALSSIYIPAKSELTTTLWSTTRSMFFLDYNFQYSNISKYIIWFGYSFAKLSQPEIEKLRSKLVKLPPMNMALFQQELNSIDEDYPLSIPHSTILAVQIIMGVTLLMALLIAIWQVCKRKKNLSTLFKVALEIKDLVTNNSGGFVNSLQSLLSNSSNSPTDVEVPTQDVSMATDTPSTSNISSMIATLPL